MADDLSSLSPRAQEILRRADEQAAALRRSRALAGTPAEAEPAVSEEAAPSGPTGEPADPEQLMDRVQTGLEASRAHLAGLREALAMLAERAGMPLPPKAPSHPVVPPALAGHAVLPHRALAEVYAPAPEEAAEEPAAAPDPPGDNPAPAATSSAAHDAARLVAIEMAVAGDSRETVGRRLRQEFGIGEPGPILDDVFGAGSTPGSRMRWRY